MNDNEISVRLCKIITTGIASVLIALILSITAYNITDRIQTGHVALTYQQVATPTK